MTGKTIASYPPCPVPLTGIELIPVWQGGAQKQATVNDVVGSAVAQTQVYEQQAQGYATALAIGTAGGWYATLSEGAADSAVNEGDGYFYLTDGRFYIGQKVGGVGVKQAEFLTQAMMLSNSGLGTAAGMDASAFEAAGTVTTHVAQADPHTQYVLKTDVGEFARDAVGAALAGGNGVRVTVNDGADTITIDAGSTFPAVLASGQYHLNASNASTLSTFATTANTMDFYLVPPLGQDIPLAALVAYVTTGVAGTAVRLGLYADNGGKPDGGALIYDSGALDTSTSGTEMTGVAASGVTLTRGTRYWLCHLANGAPTLRSVVPAATPALGMTSLSATSVVNIRRATQTYGALPATAPATSLNSSSHVAIGIKKA